MAPRIPRFRDRGIHRGTGRRHARNWPSFVEFVFFKNCVEFSFLAVLPGNIY